MSSLEGLKELLEEAPAKRAMERPDLFSISGFPHYEEVLSNWYAFFLDSEGPHGLGTLFLDTLLELSGQDDGFIPGAALKTRREYATPKGKTIDLVLHDGDERQHRIVGASHVVLIENKVYHQPVNDFEEYWNAIAAPCKAAIMLCLKDTGSSPRHFRTITHKAYMDAIVAKIPFTLNVPEPYRQYLLDLHQNIHELTAHMEYTDEVKFYLEHAERIQQMYATEVALKDYLKAEMSTVAAKLKLSLYPSGQRYWYMRNTKDDRSCYTVLLDEVLDKGASGDLIVVAELREFEEDELEQFRNDTDELIVDRERLTDRFNRGGDGWFQYAPIRIPMTSAADGKLAETVLKRINTDLFPVLKAADAFIAKSQDPT